MLCHDKQPPELRTGDALSAAGRELLENTLIGKRPRVTLLYDRLLAQPGIGLKVHCDGSVRLQLSTAPANGYDLSENSNAVDLVARQSRQTRHFLQGGYA